MKTVVIVGLHRSGTSYLSQVLHESGVPMWIRRAWPGHFEDADLLWTTIAEMKRAGCPEPWQTPENYEPTPEFLEELRRYKAKREAMGVFPYGFKQPRIAVLLPAFRRVFDDTLWICCVRNFLRSAESWRRRRNVRDVEQGLASFSRQLLCVLHDLGDAPRYFFDYDGNIEKQEKDLTRLLGRPIPLARSWRKKS